MAWLYVPGLVGSNSVLKSHSLNTAASVMLRGKPIQRRFLSRAWRRASWMKLLSGMTLRPSIADLTAKRWISSVPASRVSPGATPAAREALMMIGGSGQPLQRSFALYDHDTCSWRTSQVSLQGDWIPFSAIWPKSGMMLSGVCSQLLVSEPRTFEKEFSFLPLIGCFFPTPTSKDSDPYTAPRSDAVNSGHRRGSTLPQIVGMWPTPVAADSERNSNRYPRGNRTLLGAVQDQVPTPTVTDASGRGYTYDAGDHNKPRLSLVGVAREWPTPTASAVTGIGERKGGRNLQTAAGGKLNPTWVEWLMGWPIGWTGLEPVGMESFQRWQQGHLPSYLEDS